MLPVYDNMKRALEAATDEQREVSLRLIEGIELTMRELVNVLESTVSCLFRLKLATSSIQNCTKLCSKRLCPAPKRVRSFRVAAEGFMLHDRLLRPAQVGVSSTPG